MDWAASQTRASVFAREGVEDWVITFSNLKILELKEIRVFSRIGTFDRNKTSILPTAWTGEKTFVPLAKRILAPENGACNLTRVPCSLSKVTDLRFVFRNPGDDVNPKNLIIPLFLRLTPWGPGGSLTLAEAKEAGRANSALLSSLMRSGEAKTGFLKNRPKRTSPFSIHPSRPAWERGCLPCHGPEKQKANSGIDTLNPDLIKGGDKDWWLEGNGRAEQWRDASR